MWKQIIVLTLFLLSIHLVYGQKKSVKENTIGIQYYGELFFHPGIELDYQFNLFNKTKIKKKRSLLHQVNFRPSVAYYRLPFYSNNYSITPNLDYQLKVINIKTSRYFFVEPYIKLGYLRYTYMGEIYASTNTGFEALKRAGGNALVFGGGLNFGLSLKPNRLDSFLGIEYLGERSQGELFINHLNFKVGFRYKIKRNE